MNIKYNKIVGCGGIGKGLIFHTDKNSTLGRNESRLVELSQAKDYCKLQLVFFYIAQFLAGKEISVIPVGAVGPDALGKELIDLMKHQGMDTAHIEISKNLPTMLSVCLQYPDKEGGNITAANSAAGEVTPEYVKEVLEKIQVDDKAILVAVPEVNLESRFTFLLEGKKRKAFCAASVPAAEADDFEKSEIYSCCDLISVNEEEARAMCGLDLSGKELFLETCKYLSRWNNNMLLCVTEGKKGAWCGDLTCAEHIAPYPCRVINTTGAGDAFLGSVIAMLAEGIPFIHSADDNNSDYTATGIASACSSMAIELGDSIPESLSFDDVLARYRQSLSKEFSAP